MALQLPVFFRPQKFVKESKAALKRAPFIGAGLAALLFPAAALRVAKFVAPKTLKGAAFQILGVPTAIGLLKVPEIRSAVARFISPPKRVREAEEFGKKLVGTKPSDGGDLIKSGAKAAGVVGAVVAAVAVAKKVTGKPKVITTPEQLVPKSVLPIPPEVKPLGVVKQPVEKVSPVPSIVNQIKVSPVVNVRINQSRKFINQQLLIRS